MSLFDNIDGTDNKSACSRNYWIMRCVTTQYKAVQYKVNGFFAIRTLHKEIWLRPWKKVKALVRFLPIRIILLWAAFCILHVPCQIYIKPWAATAHIALWKYFVIDFALKPSCVFHQLVRWEAVWFLCYCGVHLLIQTFQTLMYECKIDKMPRSTYSKQSLINPSCWHFSQPYEGNTRPIYFIQLSRCVEHVNAIPSEWFGT